MSGHPWYKRYGADFIHGTLGLTLEEKGAYSLCLDLIYDHGGPIPDDERWLAGVCGVSTRKWRVLRDRLLETGKLVMNGDRLSNSRAEKEIENTAKITRKLVESGAKGGRTRAENDARSNENNDIDQATLKHRAREDTRSQKPDRESSLRSDSARTLEDDFDEFYSRYPRKAGKGAAIRAYRAARKTTDHPTIMAGVERYRVEMERRNEPQFIAHPSTWLNGARWADEAAPVVRKGAGSIFDSPEWLAAKNGDPPPREFDGDVIEGTFGRVS